MIERSTDALRSGGGVVVQRKMGDYLEGYGLAVPGELSVPATMRKLFQRDGSTLALPETARSYTAWDVLLHELETSLGAGTIRRGLALENIDQRDDGVTAILSDGTRRDGDLLVGADGVGSRTREILLPGDRPLYAGYVGWRGMVASETLPTTIMEELANSFSLFTGDHTNMVAYEVPGPDGSVRPGRRRVNWVWYTNVTEGDDLDDILIDRDGRKRKSTLSRGDIRPEIVKEMKWLASSALIEPFSSLVRATVEPFAQSILDYQAPQVFFERTVLIGDAACLIRPHLGSGTAKAVDDAIQLAEAVCGPDFHDRGCLRAWQYTRLEDHSGLAEQAKAVARRYGLGHTGEPTEPPGSRPIPAAG